MHTVESDIAVWCITQSLTAHCAQCYAHHGVRLSNVMHTIEFLFFEKIEYLSETVFENSLTCLSKAQKALNIEKRGSKISLHAPFKVRWYTVGPPPPPGLWTDYLAVCCENRPNFSPWISLPVLNSFPLVKFSSGRTWREFRAGCSPPIPTLLYSIVYRGLQLEVKKNKFWLANCK